MGYRLYGAWFYDVHKHAGACEDVPSMEIRDRDRDDVVSEFELEKFWCKVSTERAKEKQSSPSSTAKAIVSYSRMDMEAKTIKNQHGPWSLVYSVLFSKRVFSDLFVAMSICCHWCTNVPALSHTKTMGWTPAKKALQRPGFHWASQGRWTWHPFGWNSSNMRPNLGVPQSKGTEMNNTHLGTGRTKQKHGHGSRNI